MVELIAGDSVVMCWALGSVLLLLTGLVFLCDALRRSEPEGGGDE